MATLGKGDMCIFYKDGENLDDVMRITEKENVPSEELMVFLNDKGEPLTLEETNNILMQYYQPLKEFNESNNLEKIDSILESKYCKSIDGEIVNLDNLFKWDFHNEIVFSNPHIGSKFSIEELDYTKEIRDEIRKNFLSNSKDCSLIDNTASLIDKNWLLDDSELNYIQLNDKIKKRNKRKSLIIFKYKKFLEKNH